MASAQVHGTPAPDGKYYVQGRVINSVTGEPISQAIVEIPNRSMLTDADGEFQFNDLPTGDMRIAAEKPGFVAEMSDVWRYERRLRHFDRIETGSSEPRANSVILRLAPEGSITVHLEDANGDSISGARLRIISVGVYMGGKRWNQDYAFRDHITDKNGNYTATRLTAGRYYVAAQAFPEFLTSLPTPRAGWGYPSVVYYPNNPDLESATPLDIEAGQHSTISFLLKRERLFRVAGIVFGRLPGSGGTVEILDRSGTAIRIASIHPQTGKFDFGGLTAGSYTLRVRGSYSSEQILNLNSDVADLVLTRWPEMKVPVQVRFDDVNPPASVFHRYIDVILRAADQPMRIFESSSMFDQNTFEISRIHPGKYVLAAVIAAENEYVASVHSRGLDLMKSELVIDSDAPPDPIEPVMRNDAASLVGRIISNPQQESTVVLVPESAPAQIRFVDVPADGEFEMKSLAPGNYQIFAFDSVGGIEFENPAVMAQYAANATPATLQADRTKRISLNLIHNSRIDSIPEP